MSLPLKIKVGVRDHWDPKDSDVKQAFSSLKDVVGLEVALEPQWQLLWNELKDTIKEPDQFVPTISRASAAWARALAEICEEESNEQWVEDMLEKVNGAGSMIRIGLEACKSNAPSTRWADQVRGFQICFPKDVDSAMTMASTMTAKFHGDLLSAFKSADQQRETSSAEKWVDAGDDRSDLDVASVMTPATTTDRVMAMRSVATDRFPDLNLLERPEDLCAKAPYHMIIKSSDQHIIIEGSHQPSLELLSKYLKKWAKANQNLTHRPPQAEVSLRGSVFGLSTMWDRIDIEPQHHDKWTRLNPTMILCFVESILGYRMTFQDNGCWHFRRDTGFAR